ncbi:hypothetical protein IIA79_00195 [bacterium]|nr:hypothetical protein [bacterium]
MHKSREAAGNYGRSVDLSYTYNVVNQLTAISDAVDANYSCSVTCDADGSITQAVEIYSSLAIPPVIESTLTTDFTGGSWRCSYPRQQGLSKEGGSSCLELRSVSLHATCIT